MIDKCKRLVKEIGVDKTILLILFTRVIQVLGGLVSILFIAKYLSSDEQGYFYTFVSILAIQVFFELGLSGILTQYSAHEFAHLKWSGYSLSGDEYYKSRLASLLIFCFKWFGIISVIVFLTLAVLGFFYFSNFSSHSNIEWQIPWIILSASTALNLFIDPILAIFDGVGFIKDMSKVRLIQKGSYVILLLVFFMLGFKLYSAAIASLASICINYVQIFLTQRRKILYSIWKSKGSSFIDYYKEIFPYQWRIAMSWISGYFIFQLFNPILFATEGPVVAGQMGMTLQALTGISAISMSWITTKIPLFSQFIAKKDYLSLDRVFSKTLRDLLIVNSLMLSIFISVVIFLRWKEIPLSNRFLPILPTIILSLCGFVNQIVFSWAVYLRCHKSEPFLLLSLITAISVALSTLILGNQFGLQGIVWGYGAIIIFPSLIWSYLVFKQKRHEWHNINFNDAHNSNTDLQSS